MINLKKHDIVADAVLEVLQQEALKGNQDKDQVVAEGLPQILRKVVPGHAKREIDKKMDAGKFGKTDADKDANFQRYKKIQDKLKEQGVAEEELKGNQDKIDANHNGKIDGQDFKLLRAKKKVEEEIDVNDRAQDTLAGQVKTKKKDDVGPGSNGKSIKVRFHAGPQNEEAGNTLKQMKEKFEEPILDELINEVMSKDATAGDYIHDFIHSDNPKFAGKSKAKRKEMALAAYYSKKNEEVDLNEMDKSQKGAPGWNISDNEPGGKEHYGKPVKYKSFLKNAGKALHKAFTGGSDEDQRKDLQRKMGVPQTGKKPTSEEVVEEGWDDMVKDAQEKVKSGPKPSGGSGKKEGSRYGGPKQKEKPEQEVKEAKDPTMDAGCGSAPNFATNDAKPMKAAQSMAKKSLARMRSEMLGKTGTSE